MQRARFHPFFRLLFFASGSYALFWLVQKVIGMALYFSQRVTPGMPPPDLTAPGAALFFTSLLYPPILLWTWFCRHVFDRRNYVSLGLGITRAGRNFAAGGALGALSIALVFCVLLLCGAAKINGVSPEAFNASTAYIAGMLLLYGALHFAVGYFEETVFRGYLLQNFSAWWGIGAGIVAQSVLFAAFHLSNPGQGVPINKFFAMLNIALVGWLLALCYLKSGSLWYSIGFHAAWNFFLGCVFSLPVSGNASFRLLDVSISENALLTGSAFGPEGGVLPVLLLLALIWQTRRLPDHARATTEIEALRNSEALQRLPLTPAPIAAPGDIPPPSTSPEATESTPEYSPPRYKTTLGAPLRRPAPIDWSDVNTRGGAPSTATFTPGVSPAASESSTVGANTSEASVSATPQDFPETMGEYSPVAFTPNVEPQLPTTTMPGEVTPHIRNAESRDAFSTSQIGEAPLPAGARLKSSRSNFGGAAPADIAQDVKEQGAMPSDVGISPDEAPQHRFSAPPPLPRVPHSATDENVAFDREAAVDETSASIRSVPAPPPLPSTLPAPPPMQEPSASTLSPPESETSHHRIPPPPALQDLSPPGPSETLVSGLPAGASTRAISGKEQTSSAPLDEPGDKPQTPAEELRPKAKPRW